MHERKLQRRIYFSSFFFIFLFLIAKREKRNWKFSYSWHLWIKQIKITMKHSQFTRHQSTFYDEEFQQKLEKTIHEKQSKVVSDRNFLPFLIRFHILDFWFQIYFVAMIFGWTSMRDESFVRAHSILQLTLRLFSTQTHTHTGIGLKLFCLNWIGKKIFLSKMFVKRKYLLAGFVCEKWFFICYISSFH